MFLPSSSRFPSNWFLNSSRFGGGWNKVWIERNGREKKEPIKNRRDFTSSFLNYGVLNKLPHSSKDSLLLFTSVQFKDTFESSDPLFEYVLWWYIPSVTSTWLVSFHTNLPSFSIYFSQKHPLDGTIISSWYLPTLLLFWMKFWGKFWKTIKY